jgi:hypothetical protein
MAPRKRTGTRQEGTAGQIVSAAVGAAETLSVGVLRLTGRTIIETVHTVQDIGNELGSMVVRTAHGSIRAAEEIGGDLVEVGKGVTRGVVEPARQMGGGVARLATRLWGHGERVADSGRPRKGRAKATGRRSRRRPAA